MDDETYIDIDEFDEEPAEDDAQEETKDRFRVIKSVGGWVKNNSGAIFLAVLPAVLKIMVQKREYENYLYTTDQDGKVFRIPAKELKTCGFYNKKKMCKESEAED